MLTGRLRPIACLAGVTLMLCLCLESALAAQPLAKGKLQQVQTSHRKRFREFSNQIEKLAEFCDDKALTEDAAFVRSRIILPETLSLRTEQLPNKVQPEIPAGMVGDERHWKTQLRYLETVYAKDLHLQARASVKDGFPSYAYNLIREAALHDPDNTQVRKILGFERLKDEWITSVAASQIKKGFVWHESFGWIPKSHLQRYIDGDRYFNSRWVTAKKEAELRRDFGSAWEVRTDHYLIKTNVNLEKGVEMGKALEDFYSVFNETFAGFFHTPEQLKKLFFEGGASKFREPFVVHFYASRDEYLQRMRKFFPSIDQTNGVYLTSDRVAHFYYDPKQEHEGTLYHEATHQLFFGRENPHANRTICENHHFWIIEGIACYMESFQRKDGSFMLGNPTYVRFDRSRYNLLHDKYYVPLREFSGYGMQEFQHSPELVKNYTQAAGLARFFMHYDNGRYREALVNHLSQLYSINEKTRERAEGLDELTGVEFSELDRQYADDAAQVTGQISSR